MTENETYQIIAECDNCGHIPKEKTTNGTVVGPLKYNIPWGQEAAKFLSTQTCPNCGFKGLLKRQFS